MGIICFFKYQLAIRKPPATNSGNDTAKKTNGDLYELKKKTVKKPIAATNNPPTSSHLNAMEIKTPISNQGKVLGLFSNIARIPRPCSCKPDSNANANQNDDTMTSMVRAA